MITFLKKSFSSISWKLFIWFWLVTILSITATRFISHQFSDDGFVMPAHQGDIHRINNLLKKSRHSKNFPLNLTKKRFGNRDNISIWIKNLSTLEVMSSQQNHIAPLKDYLQKNDFTDVVSVQFPYARLTGPVAFSKGDTNYQLYFASRTRKPPFGFFLINLPQWARIAVPLSISFLLCWLLAKTLSRPLAKMQQAAQKLGQGELSTRVHEVSKRNDELGQLAVSFNTMAAQLEQHVSAQQRLLGDMSHELRSPMTRLQLAIALSQKSIDNPEELSKYLARSELEIQKLDEMIGHVLKLSRLENSHQSLTIHSLDSGRFLQTLIDDAQFMAQSKNIQIKADIEPSYPIKADQQLLASAIANVLTNAVKYSPENSIITLSSSVEQEQFVIEIMDQGQGVAEQELNQLFEPFYRVNSARERSTGGTGLGLAIAKQAILAHHGSIKAQNYKATDDAQQIQGLSVVIKLPL